MFKINDQIIGDYNGGSIRIVYTQSIPESLPLAQGVYPQSEESFAIVYINASKGFVDLWVHLSFAVFAIFDLKRQLTFFEMAFDQVQTCLIFPFRWAHYPIKNSRKAQRVHQF